MQRQYCSIIVVLAGLALAHASPKQVTFSPPAAVVSPSPPPPSGNTPSAPTFLSPGLDFSIIVPGYTSSAAFSTAQQNALCNAITTGWTQAADGRSSTCTVGSVSSYNGTSVLVSGVAYYTWTSVPTVTDLQSASAQRDATVATLTTTANSILGTSFPGAVANCNCNGLSVVTKSSTTPFTYATTIAGVLGPMQCDAHLTYDTSNANAQINQVGVDDGTIIAANLGKYCSTPAVTGGVVGVPGAGSCRQYGVLSPDSTVLATATAFSTASGGRATQITGGPCGVGVTTNCFTPGSGYTTNPTVKVSAPTPTSVQVKFPWNGGGVSYLNRRAAPRIPTNLLEGTIVNPINGPYASPTSYPIGTVGGGTCVDTGKGAIFGRSADLYFDHKCTGPITTIQDPNGRTRTGYTCTSDDFNAGHCFGGTCITMGGTNNAVTSVTYPGYYKGAADLPDFSRGVYCTASPTITFDTSTLQTASYAQFNAVISTSGATNGQVTSVTMVSPGSGYTTNPTLTIASPIAGNTAKLCGPNPIPSLPADIASPISSSISVGGACTPLGRDTVSNLVCSVPAAPNGGTYGPLNVGSCNVVSSFIPQPNSAVSSTCGILPQVFNVSASAPAPTPAPAPAPTPTPAPAPAPASITCTYDGTYFIEAVACAGQFIAYNNDPAKNDACNNATLMLRTAAQSQGPRRYWDLSATAVSGTVPTASGMIASGRTGKCVDDGLTNLAAANSAPSPRLAGSGWKNRIIPVDATKSCDTVWIQAAGNSNNAGKYLGYGSCSSQTAFTWSAASSSTAIQWKLTKA